MPDATNRGATSLKATRCRKNPMHEFDRLPPELRLWLSRAALPWRAGSVRDAYARAFAKTGSADLALRELDALQARLIAKDAAHVWGRAHPAAAPLS